MNKVLLCLVLSSVVSLPSRAAMKDADKAPDFSAPASLAGKEYNFSLKDALNKGPVEVYYYPSAYTKGCDIEAHTFAQEKEKFDAACATIIGVWSVSVARFITFSGDPEYCAGKFPVASDENRKIAGSYDLTVNDGKPDMKDLRGEEIGHAFIERVTYVIGRDQEDRRDALFKEDKDFACRACGEGIRDRCRSSPNRRAAASHVRSLPLHPPWRFRSGPK